ncbi:MAG: DUF72 domain-containing protein [Chloroflexi bacterium]|nr:MAG: hypothetical protein B6I35_06720 [Anaerolineaceae bacterium 4572_32.2]RLC75298.1 MAG: DUF72 domain-containing protein [Chloroflexota bacterium]RLC79810.1 MAG: DUF72 domain-containing protein [Chloroflexota bacterium]HEY72329.1 DUF72 domain-containing protein [Thermoflexia bacterium]
MTILIGTSGFSYKDWVGPVYPKGLPKAEWLPFYAAEFPTCELNFSYYRIPNARTLSRMADKVPEGFLFTVKAYKGITHERETAQATLAEQIEQLVTGLAPLIEAKKFACVLLQFPYSFHANQTNRDYIKRVREGLGNLPAVVEFRSREWINERTFGELRALDLGFCCVDQPRFKNLVPPVAVATGPVAYVRFHGRNRAKWWQHDEAWERYDYTYSGKELEEWLPKIRQLDEEAPLTLVYMNNHWQGQAVGAARQLKMLMEETS